MKKYLIFIFCFFCINNLFADDGCDAIYLGNSKLKLKSSNCVVKKDFDILKEYNQDADFNYSYPAEIKKILNKKCGERKVMSNYIRKPSKKCLKDAAGKKVYEIFAQRSEIYHARYPGKIIEGMAWFEILFMFSFEEKKKIIERYEKHSPTKYRNLNEISVSQILSKIHPKTAMAEDRKKIYNLIKMNKGRLKMRKAIGLSNENTLIESIDRQILLANFLNRDKLKVKKKKIDPDLKKREKLLNKYKSTVTKYKEKLQEGL